MANAAVILTTGKNTPRKNFMIFYKNRPLTKKLLTANFNGAILLSEENPLIRYRAADKVSSHNLIGEIAPCHFDKAFLFEVIKWPLNSKLS